MPSDVSRLDSERVEVIANDYLDAQHIRSHCIARIALALMGLGHVPLTRQDGGTIDQLMDKAIARAGRGDDAGEPLGFWQVRLDCAPADGDDDAPEPNARQA